MVAKKYQNPKGGLNAAGRKFLNALRAAISNGRRNPELMVAALVFAARFAGMRGPMKDEKGRPTRKALALKA